MKKINSLMAIGVFAFLFTTAAFGQGGATGAISGSVQDASGGSIAGARVVITSEATGQVIREVTTDSTGLFSATLLPAGFYTVEASATGFAATKFSGIEVRVTDTVRMTAVLKVTGVQQEVVVTGQVAAVNTTAP